MERISRELLLRCGFIAKSNNVFFKKDVSEQENIFIINIIYNEEQDEEKYTTTFGARLYTFSDLQMIWFLLTRQYLQPNDKLIYSPSERLPKKLPSEQETSSIYVNIHLVFDDGHKQIERGYYDYATQEFFIDISHNGIGVGCYRIQDAFYEYCELQGWSYIN